MVADEVPFSDMRSRRQFGTKIKDISMNSLQTCHGKFQKAVHLKPCWRLTVSLNDEPENLVMLPFLDASIKDKIMLFKIRAAKMPMPCNSPQDRESFWRALLKELPGFLEFVESFDIPDELHDSRFSIAAFQHRELLEILGELSPEIRLLELIDSTLMVGGNAWRGTLSELEAFLLGDQTYGRQIEKLLYFPTALRTYMRRLRKNSPHRVDTARSNNKIFWTIKPNSGG